MKIDEIGTFSQHCGTLTKMLAGAARGKTESMGDGGRVGLSNVDTRELAGFKDKLICQFILAVDMIRGDIQEFVNDTDGPVFLERELMGLGVDGYR